MLNALENLSEQERFVILLRYMNRLNISEIAEVLGISKSTVERRMRAAINNLKDFMDEVI